MEILFPALALFVLGLLASVYFLRRRAQPVEAEDIPAVPAEVMARAYAAFSHTLLEEMKMQRRVEALVAVLGDRPDWEQQASFLRTLALLSFLSQSDDLDGLIRYASPGVAMVDERLIRAAAATPLRTDSAGFDREALLAFAGSATLEPIVQSAPKPERPHYPLKEYGPFGRADGETPSAPP